MTFPRWLIPAGDQWHTMTRTASAPRLLAHRSEPFVEVHPEDMARLNLVEGYLARLTLKNEQFVGRVRGSGEQRPGEVFIPIHWSRQFASSGVATVLTEPVTDPVSGQPEAKHGRAAITPFRASWHGRLLTRRNRPRRWQADYWCHVPLNHCDSWWVAGRQPLQWLDAVADWLGGAAHVVMADPAQGCFRAARIVNGQLEAVLMVDSDPARIPDTCWLDDCFSEPQLSESSRRALLAARDVDVEDPGAIICSCFQVGEHQIGAAIAGGAESVAALGEQLRCGTNGGSCIPELRSLLDTSVSESA